MLKVNTGADLKVERFKSFQPEADQPLAEKVEKFKDNTEKVEIFKVDTDANLKV